MSDKGRLENMSPIGIDLNGNVLLKGDDYHWLLNQAEKAERYEKALREIANEQEVGEGDFNADDVANNLIATAKEALEESK